MTRLAVSLFDESGVLLRPFANLGWECHMFDNDTTPRFERLAGDGSMTWHKLDLYDEASVEAICDMFPDFVACFAPCTDVAGSGARHWAKKLAADPDCQKFAVEKIRLAERIGNAASAPWFTENPVGAVSTLWRKPDAMFDPCDFGGYLDRLDVHPDYPQYFPPRDAYTKRTCLWFGNGFVMPVKKPVMPVYLTDSKGRRWSWIAKKLGGKSAKTKRIRSKTPRGFAQAVALANA